MKAWMTRILLVLRINFLIAYLGIVETSGSKIRKENNSVVDVTVLFLMLDVTTFSVGDRSVIEDIAALSYFN